MTWSIFSRSVVNKPQLLVGRRRFGRCGRVRIWNIGQRKRTHCKWRPFLNLIDPFAYSPLHDFNLAAVPSIYFFSAPTALMPSSRLPSCCSMWLLLNAQAVGSGLAKFRNAAGKATI